MMRGWMMLGMGIWLAGTLFFAVVAAENFYTVDRLLAHSDNATFHTAVDRLGHAATRELLRYVSSELNRLYFQLWNVSQLVIGIPLLWSAVRTSSPRKATWGLAVMLGIVVFMTVWLTPQIVSVGRSLDFMPRDPAPPRLRTFWILHGGYAVLDLLILLIGGVVAFWIAQGMHERSARRAVA